MTFKNQGQKKIENMEVVWLGGLLDLSLGDAILKSVRRVKYFLYPGFIARFKQQNRRICLLRFYSMARNTSSY